MGIEPFDRIQSFPAWKAAIADLAAQCPNVHVKLSGLAMVSCGFDFHLRPSPPSSAELAEAWAPYVLHCIECFGVNRCMFASNFPVDKVSCSYTNLFNAMKRIVSSFSETDKNLLFFGTVLNRRVPARLFIAADIFKKFIVVIMSPSILAAIQCALVRRLCWRAADTAPGYRGHADLTQSGSAGLEWAGALQRGQGDGESGAQKGGSMRK